MLLHHNSNKWIDYISDVNYNYNHNNHSFLGKAPKDVKREDIPKIIKHLWKLNKPSQRRLNSFQIGDRVRYLVTKAIFAKGSNTFSKDVWTVTGTFNYQIRIQHGNIVKFKKQWELKRV